MVPQAKYGPGKQLPELFDNQTNEAEMEQTGAF